MALNQSTYTLADTFFVKSDLPQTALDLKTNMYNVYITSLFFNEVCFQ